MDVEDAIIGDWRGGYGYGYGGLVENPRRGDMLIRSFLRARVVVDIGKQLCTSMWTRKPNGEPVWITAKHKRLQNLCYVE